MQAREAQAHYEGEGAEEQEQEAAGRCADGGGRREEGEEGAGRLRRERVAFVSRAEVCGARAACIDSFSSPTSRCVVSHFSMSMFCLPRSVHLRWRLLTLQCCSLCRSLSSSSSLGAFDREQSFSEAPLAEDSLIALPTLPPSRSAWAVLRLSMLPRLRIRPPAGSSSSPSALRLARPPPTPPPHRTRAASTLAQQRRQGGGRRTRTAGLVGLAAAGAGLYAYDELNAHALLRSLRTLVFGVTLALDFKLNFDAADTDGIDRIHERTARRLSALVDANQGMYIKLAQSLAIQAAILPKPYRDAFANVFDAAPAVGFDEVVRVFRREFGQTPDEAFEVFERTPVASASIAQVHKARLRSEEGRPWANDDEGWVAVKVRKEAVPKQMEWCVRRLCSPLSLSSPPAANAGQHATQGPVLLPRAPLVVREAVRPPRRLHLAVRLGADAQGGPPRERGAQRGADRQVPRGRARAEGQGHRAQGALEVDGREHHDGRVRPGDLSSRVNSEESDRAVCAGTQFCLGMSVDGQEAVRRVQALAERDDGHGDRAFLGHGVQVGLGAFACYVSSSNETC